MKPTIYRITLIITSLLLSALLYNILLLPLNLVTGGVAGIATITNYVYSINPAIMIFVLSFVTLILSFMYLGTERTTGSILSTILYPVFVYLTSFIRNIVFIDTSDLLLVVLFAGVISGIANGLMYRSGYGRGGLPIISQILFEKFRISIAKSTFILNGLIVLVGILFFGLTKALYAIIFLYINSIIMDRVLLGISKNKAFYIITEKEEKVKEYIMENLRHTVTTFDVKGGFLQDKKKVILTVIPTREYYRVTEGIKSIDKDVFFVVTDSYEAKGAK